MKLQSLRKGKKKLCVKLNKVSDHSFNEFLKLFDQTELSLQAELAFGDLYVY